jgi:hypothetical protein
MPKIDVSRYVRELEIVLLSQQDLVRCENAIAILRRWQFDQMLDDASRAKAAKLVREFDSTQWWHTMFNRPVPSEPTVRKIPERTNSRRG